MPLCFLCLLTNFRDSSEGVSYALDVSHSEALLDAPRSSLPHQNGETVQLRKPRLRTSGGLIQNSATPTHISADEALPKPPAQNSSTAAVEQSLQIEYSPCPVRTTKSLLALRRRLADVFVQPYRSVGTLRPTAQRSHDNPIYFALRQDESSPCKVSVRKKTSSEFMSCGLAKSSYKQNVDVVPFKLRRKDPSLCFLGQKTGQMKRRIRCATSEDRNNYSRSYSNRVTLSPLSRDMASLRLSNCSRDASALQQCPRITPPSPFLNCTTFIANILSASQYQPVQAPCHDVTDPRFLSLCSVLESGDMPFSSSNTNAVTSHADELRDGNQDSLHTTFSQGPVNRVLYYPEESPVKRTDGSQEPKHQPNKRPSLRRGRTVSSNSEEGPPVKLHHVISSDGQLMLPTLENGGTPRSLSSSNTRVVRRSSETGRMRKTLMRFSKRQSRGDERAILMGLGDGALAGDSVLCDSDFSNEVSPGFDVYPDSREQEFLLKRQGGFRRRQRTEFKSTAASDSCLLKVPQRSTNRLSGLTLSHGIPSPFSPQDTKCWLPDLTSVSTDMSCHVVGLPRTESVQSSSHQAVHESSLNVVGRLNNALSCFSIPPRFGLTLSKGIPSPPSPTNDNGQHCPSVGIAGIKPLSSSPVPPAQSSNVFTLKQMGGAGEEQGTSSSDDTWDSHKLHSRKTSVGTEGHVDQSDCNMKDAGVGKSTDRTR